MEQLVKARCPALRCTSARIQASLDRVPPRSRHSGRGRQERAEQHDGPVRLDEGSASGSERLTIATSKRTSAASAPIRRQTPDTYNVSVLPAVRERSYRDSEMEEFGLPYAQCALLDVLFARAALMRRAGAQHYLRQGWRSSSYSS
jgi:hypothetical protein